MKRSKEDGIVMVMALFMILVMSTLGVSLMFTAQTETWSSQNYKMMSQARYSAESGMQTAANYLMYTYQAPSPTNANDPIANYTYQYITPVTANNATVLLSTTANSSNYPVAAVKTAFHDATNGSMTIDNGTSAFSVSSRLMSMENFTDYVKKNVTIQTWEITGTGTVNGARSGETSVTALLERPKNPAYGYAAFATYDGCDALHFGGGASTDSYDSRDPLAGGVPVLSASGGAVGTNGNLSGVGATTMINGSLSTPRSGVGNCTANNVTAESIDPSQVKEGLTELAQPINYPTPDAPNPMPPLTDLSVNGGGSHCGDLGLAAPQCTFTGGNTVLDPGAGTIVLGNIKMNGGSQIHFSKGNYTINSLQQNGSSTIFVDSGPVVINVAGATATPGVWASDPIKLNGGGISNTLGGKFDPMNLQFIYAGTETVTLDGGADTCALLYAPNSTAKFNSSGSNWYGAIVTKYVSEMGGVNLHYDRRLGGEAFIAGNWTLSAFTWKKY